MPQDFQAHFRLLTHRRCARAFTLRDLRLAFAWQDSVKSVGYRLAITLDDPAAEEVVNVTVIGLSKPLFTLTRRLHGIRVVTPGGEVCHVGSMQAALDAVSPLSSTVWRRLSACAERDCNVTLPATEPRLGWWPSQLRACRLRIRAFLSTCRR